MKRHTKTHQPLEVAFDSAGLCVLESRHSDDFRMDWTRHPFGKILLVVAGRGTIEAGGARWPLEPGTMVVVPRHTQHRLRDDQARPLTLYILCLANVTPFANWETEVLGGEGHTIRFITNSNAIATAQNVLRHLLFARSHALDSSSASLRFAGRLALHTGSSRRLRDIGLVCNLLTELAGVEEKRRRPLPQRAETRVRNYVRSMPRTFYDAHSIDDVATQLDMSRRRFTQLFREISGAPWHVRLTEMRIAHARQLLRTTARSIPAIAFECGFEDLTTFYRAFKKTTSTSPLAWRDKEG